MRNRLSKVGGAIVNLTLTLVLLVGFAIYQASAGPCGVMMPSPGSTMCNGDVNGDQAINVADGVYLLTYLFSGGPAPVAFAQSPPTIPPGSVVAFAGDVATVPAGWLLCDGSVYSQTVYPDLFGAIGTAHGGDVMGGTIFFRVPDYRGTFLRGVDGGVGSDPDADCRQAPSSLPIAGNTGDAVGSIQGFGTAIPTDDPCTPLNESLVLSTTGSHDHGGMTGLDGGHSHSVGFEYWASACFMGFTCGGQDILDCGATPGTFSCTRSTSSAPDHSHSIAADGDHTHGMTGGHLESRPVNAAVHWIIKY